MLTRIISGAALVVITASVIFCTVFFEAPLVLTAFLAFLGATASIELLSGTGIIKNKVVIIASAVYSAAAQFLYTLAPKYILVLSLAYGVVALLLTVRDKLSYKRIIVAVIAPAILSYAFSCISVLLSFGLVNLLLLLNFSSVCDCGAYFVGVTIGKHKLCPKISPKKTVEGAVGGIIVSMLVTAVIARLFSLDKILILVIITPILCIAGIIGDLLASVIKRKVGIKDYGKIIPGHGGIMDRFDSILLIAPIYVILYSFAG